MKIINNSHTFVRLLKKLLNSTFTWAQPLQHNALCTRLHEIAPLNKNAIQKKNYTVRPPNVERAGLPVAWRYHAAKFGWRPLLECRAVTLPIYSRLACKVNFALGKVPLVGKSPQNVYNVPAQYTTKHRAKFGWPPLSDVGAVMKPRRETRWNLLGCPKLDNRSQPLVGRSSPYYEDMWRRYCCLIFSRLSIRRYSPTKLCMVRRWLIFA